MGDERRDGGAAGKRLAPSAGEKFGRDEREALAALVKNSPMGMHFYRLEANGRLVFTGGNPAADRILGLDNSRYVGKTIEEAFPPLAASEIPARYRAAAATGARWSTEQVEYEHEEVRGAYEVHAFQTTPGQMVAVFFDITERKLAQQRLETQRDLATALGATDDFKEALRRCLDAALRHSGADAGGVYLVDARGGLDLIVHAGISSQFATGVMHYEPESFEARAVREARPFYGLKPDQDTPTARRVIEERLGSVAVIPIAHRNEVVACLNVGARQPGRFTPDVRQWLETIGAQISGAVARLRSLEHRRLLEAQLQQAMKMEAIGRLAGGVAHDFNNLLTAIAGNVSLALRELDSSQRSHELLLASLRAVESAAALTRQLLAFSRKQLIQPRPIELNAMISNLGSMLTRLIGEDVELLIRPGPRPCPLVADPAQVEQILVNLAINARDAMPGGGRVTVETSVVELDEVYCRAQAGARPGRYARLTVTDTGSGMTEEVQQHLFEPFFTTKPVGRGTGLGLATTYGAVSQSGGFMEVQTELGRGTSVRVFFPFAQAPTESVPKDREAGTRLPGGTETILVVEDEPLVLRIAAQILRELGYQVLTADGGARALERAARHAGPIDLLLTDVVMPGMDGRHLAEQLVVQRPELRVLFTSGYNEDIISHSGVLDRGLEFLSKPYTPESLASKVRQVLDQVPAMGNGLAPAP